MDSPPAARKVAFVLFSMLLMLTSLIVLSQKPAEAASIVPDNTPFSSDGTNFYIVRAGTSFKILNIETLNACFGGQENVRKLNGLQVYYLVAYSRFSGKVGCPVIYANGSLLKGTSQATVYVKQNDKLYVVPSPDLVECLGGWNNVKIVSDTEISWAANAYTVSGTYHCPVKQYAEGTLLQASGPGVYRVSQGKRFGIPNPDVLSCFGGWAYVNHVSDVEFSAMVNHYSDGGAAVCPYSLPNGSKVQYGGTVFAIQNGHTFGIPSPEVLNGCFGGWAGVRVVDTAEMNLIFTTYSYAGAGSCPYSLPNWSKVLAPSGTVFIVSGGLTFGMPSADVLNTCYGGWGGVRTISQAETDLMLSVYPYAGAAACALPQTGDREQKAVDWARSQIGTTYYNGWCELFIENAYGTSGRYASAVAQANSKISRGLMHSGDTNVPVGAIAYFGSAKVNGGYGHVIISIGGGQFVSSGYYYNGHTYGAYVTAINEAYMGPYLGWAWADDGWSR